MMTQLFFWGELSSIYTERQALILKQPITLDLITLATRPTHVHSGMTF